MEDTRARAQRRDRWVSWIVLGILVIALILGWVVKTLAESRTITYNDGAIRIQYPDGWFKAQASAPALLQVEDKWARPFRTTLRLEKRPLSPDAPKPLALLQQTLTLERARNLTAYRVLETEESVPIGSYTALHVTFAYVETNPDPFMETVPVVMHGEDYIIPDGNQAYVFTLTAAEANYAQAQRSLQNFVRSFQK